MLCLEQPHQVLLTPQSGDVEFTDSAEENLALQAFQVLLGVLRLDDPEEVVLGAGDAGLERLLMRFSGIPDEATPNSGIVSILRWGQKSRKLLSLLLIRAICELIKGFWCECKKEGKETRVWLECLCILA